LFSMVKHYLITTALEETWPESETVLFLGEWCQRYSRKARWSKMDSVVLPYHWDDRNKLYADYQYLSEFHERLLVNLTTQLNQIHGVNHNLRYWQILIGPWLGYFTQMLFDRWTSIQLACSQYDLSGTIILTGHEETLIPNDMGGFPVLFVNDEWNHHLCAAILKEFTSVPCVKQDRPERNSVLKALHTENWKSKVRRAIELCYSKVASVLTRDQDAFFLNTYLPRLDELRLCRRLREVPQFWPLVPTISADANMNQRQWVVNGESRSDFESCAYTLIPRQIPTVYLEGYERLIEQASGMPWPRQPKMIWTSNSHNSNDVFKAWAAEKTECGSPLVIGQHGGCYGMGRWLFNENHDIAISDCYLSWGWSEPDQPKVNPVGQLKAKQPLKVRHAEQTGALLVTGVVTRYSYHMFSAMVSRQWINYFNDQCAFVEKLPAHIREALTVRLRPQDFGWDQAARWRDSFPNVQLDDGLSNINDLIRQSRLYIATYNATTYLESFSMNIPTVIYWNPCHWELRDSAIPYFEDLKRVGIFHDTPGSAARHVATIWDDVDAWWKSPELQKVLKNFKERYCHTDKMLDRLEATLRSVMVGPINPSPVAMDVEKISTDML
jgi:putative transferase (TIGR04331 family)